MLCVGLATWKKSLGQTRLVAFTDEICEVKEVELQKKKKKKGW